MPATMDPVAATEAIPEASSTSFDGSSGRQLDKVQVLVAIIGVVGLLGNLFVVGVILRVASMRKKLANMLIVNQSAIDAVAGLIEVGIAAQQFLGNTNEGLAGLAGELYCKIWLSQILRWAILISSTYNLVAITFERYLMVAHPIHYKINFTRNRALYAIAVIWLMGPLYQMLNFFTHVVDSDGVCHTYTNFPSPGVQKFYGIATISFKFLIPLIIHPTLYSRMVVVMRRRPPLTTSQQQQQQHAGPGAVAAANSQSAPKISRTQKNLLKTMAIVTVCFFLCWSWNQLVFFFYNIGVDYDLSSDFHVFTTTAVYVNCCINPFVYVLTWGEFKAAARKLFFKQSKVGALDQSVSNSTDDSKY